MTAAPNLGVAGQDLEDLCEETSSASHLKLSKHDGFLSTNTSFH